MMKKKRNKTSNVFFSASALALAALIGGAPTAAVAQQCADDSGPSKTLQTPVARVLQEVFVAMQEERYTDALAQLNQLMAQRGNNMPAYDRATTLELRGSVKVNLEDFAGALRDFRAALDANGLPVSRNNQLQFFIAQLQFQEEQYQQAISGLNRWIQNSQQCGETVSPNAYYLLAAAYTQVTPPNYRAAQVPAEQAVNGLPEPKKGYFDLLNLIYSENSETSKRLSLLERMVNNWSGEKSYWTQLSALYSTSGRDRDAFAVMEVAYRAGLLTTESELKTLVQYYSFFENPYRGAVMLEREMAAGNIDRDQDNLVLLSQLWSQSREHKKSIPILQEAARNSSKGDLSYRLGQVLLADEQYARAETALEAALRKGGMSRKNTGDTYLLLGTARFNQAGPSDVEMWDDAIEAFDDATRYEDVAARARDWITYIRAVKQTYIDGIELEIAQKTEACENDQARQEQKERIRDLQNRLITPEEETEIAEFIERCKGFLNLDDNGEPIVGGSEGDGTDGGSEDATEEEG